MKDLTKVFIDLSKCSEEQIKALPQIFENAGESVFRDTRIDLENGTTDRGHLLEFYIDEWINTDYNYLSATTELLYPEFIKLFEGGEGEKHDLEALAEESVSEVKRGNTDYPFRGIYKAFFKEGFKKAMELNSK